MQNTMKKSDMQTEVEGESNDYSFCGYTTPGNRRVTERKDVRDRQVRDDWP